MIKLIFGLAFVSMVLGEEYPGFKSLGDDRKYFISENKLSGGDARAACNFKGWTLAREQKPEDTKLLNEALVNSKRTEKDYWIGGYLFENDSNPEWIWLDTGDVVKYENWEGKKVPISSRRCMLKTTEGDVSGKWKAAACAEAHHFICRVR